MQQFNETEMSKYCIKLEVSILHILLYNLELQWDKSIKCILHLNDQVDTYKTI